MKHSRIELVIGLVLSLLISTPALAGKVKPKAKSRVNAQKQVAARKPASISDLRTTGNSPLPKEKDLEVTVNLYTGYAMARSSDAGEQALRDGSHFDRNGYFGLSADLRFQKYEGLELEGYYSTGRAGAEGAKLDRAAGTISDVSRSLKQYGIMGALKWQYPIRVGQGTLTPKLGAGYGLLGLKQNDTDAISNTETESNLKMQGPYAMIGLDAEILPSLILTVDGSLSVFGGGSINSTSGDQDLDSARYLRVRTGLYYKFTPSFLAGGQYNRRELKYQLGGTDGKEALDQFLALVGVSF